MYVFTNYLGSHVLDKNFNIIDTDKSEDKLLGKHKNALKPADPKTINKLLQAFKKDAKGFYQTNVSNTKKLISASVTDDNLITNAIKSSQTLDKSANALCRTLRDWYSLYSPEIDELISDNEGFVRTILKKDKKTLQKELKIEESMGKELGKDDVDEIMSLAREINNLYDKRENIHMYIEKVMKRICPNVLALTGPAIGAKLISQAGSIEKMVLMPASTIQLLGAEEALFRHIKTGAKPPKYGILMQHKIVAYAKKKDKGKAAKMLADKISIAVKVDYFKGKFIGDKLIREVEKKFS